MTLAYQVKKIVDPLYRRVMLMVSRGVVSLVKDSLKLQGLQVDLLDSETTDDIERFQEYGFSSVPLAGAECVVVHIGGNRDHGLVIAVDDRSKRPKNGEPGDSVMYGSTDGILIRIRGGEIRIGGDTGLNTLIDSRLIALFNLHTHTGVTAGTGVSGTPSVPLVEVTCATSVTKAK